MRFLWLVLINFVIMASPPQSAPDGVRRIEYPHDNFSLAVPTSWSEIEPSVLASMPGATRQAAPNAPDFTVKHGFKASATPGPSFPWVAIVLTGDRVDETMFEKMDWAYRTADELTKKWESSGGTLQKAQMNSMSYDKGRHLLWGISQSTFSGVGDLQTLSGAYLTTTGSIQVHCYSRAAEFAKYRLVCKDIIESVVINPKIVISGGPAK